MRQRTIFQRLSTGTTGGAAAVAVLVGVLVGVSACGDDAPPGTPSQAVVTSYTQFTSAIAAKDGDKAAGLLTTSALSYFDTLRNSALDDDATTLAKRSVLDQITVFSLRFHIPAATLRSAEPKALVSAAVKDDAIAAGSAPQQPLKDVKINGNAATAVLTLGEADSQQTQTISFARESGAWKFDLTSLFGPAAAQLKSIQRSTGYTSAKLVESVSLDRYGKEKAKQLEQPVGR